MIGFKHDWDLYYPGYHPVSDNAPDSPAHVIGCAFIPLPS